MTVLVFGKTGQVAQELARLGDVICMDRSQADLSDPAACAEIIAQTDASAVINAAAYTAVDRAEDEETLATRINGLTPAALARTAAARGLPFVQISTDYVFDGSGDQPWTPDAPTAPLNAYGRSKLAGEEGVRAAAGPHVILRTSWVFSALGANFVKTMLRLSESRDQLTVVADQIGGPTWAGDIARTCLTLAEALMNGHPGGTYHLSGGPDTSWASFAREIFAQAGRATHVTDIPTANYPTPAKRPANSRLDCTSLTCDFAIPRPDWRAGLTHVLKELKE